MVTQLNFLLMTVWAFMCAPFMLENAHDVFYVPSMWAFCGYMLVAIISHDFLFYHAHRYNVTNN